MWFDFNSVVENLYKTPAPKVDDRVVATCLHCEEEIKKNPSTAAGGWTWESEDMLGWCDTAPQRKHVPNWNVRSEL